MSWKWCCLFHDDENDSNSIKTSAMICITLYYFYKGKAHDAVGPCEYDPKIDVKFRTSRKADFSNVIHDLLLISLLLWIQSSSSSSS